MSHSSEIPPSGKRWYARVAATMPELHRTVLDLPNCVPAVNGPRLQATRNPMDAQQLGSLAASLAGRYRIERAIGAGGMATVYLAHDLKHHRRVAIKVLKPYLAAALGPGRFLREIEVTAGLNHPHVIPLYDSGEVDGCVFYVMPYVEGESLRERLRREKQLPVDEAVSIAREVASALAYAHARGVVHRDVKPENILLVDGHAVIADFGIARALAEAGAERLTQTGLTLGTPAYMSPEQAVGERDLDGRTDIYALGCVLYEALAGEPPYTGATAQVILAKHIGDAVPSVRRIRETVPEQVDSAITGALAKLRADRFATARLFAEALAEPGTSSPTMPAARSPRRARGAGVSPRITVAVRIVFASVAVLSLLLALNVSGVRDAVARRLGVAPSAAVDRRSVAVLPFENVGGNPEEEYFSDGLTDELIAALSQLRSLRVAARTSSFAFKGQARDIREIARALNVRTVLAGTVRKGENRLRVTAQLIDASTGLGIWSDTYDDERPLADVFDIQADLALRIAGALQANLTAAERERLARKPTENLQAYTLYLKGRYALSERNEGMFNAIEYFKQAIAVDPKYARAHAGLASTYAPLAVHGYLHPREGRERMREAVRQAVELDDGLGEAHAALAGYLNVYEWDWVAAEREYRRAIVLDPNFPTTYVWYQFLLIAAGRLDEAMDAGKKAQELDPLAPLVGPIRTLRLQGSYDLAKAAARDGVELHPNAWLMHSSLGEVLLASGEAEEAVAVFERAAELAGRTTHPKAGLARALALAGRGTEARVIIQELRAEAAKSNIDGPAIATALAALGDTDAAIRWLEAAHRQRHPALMQIQVEPG